MKTILHAALITLLAIFTAANFSGCRTTPELRLEQYAADARDLGEVGTRIALLENPGYREAIESTIFGLRELEAQPDAISLDSLTAVLLRLPVARLETEKARLYITGGRILLRRFGADRELINLGGCRTIVIALRQGMEAGLQ